MAIMQCDKYGDPTAVIKEKVNVMESATITFARGVSAGGGEGCDVG